MMSDYKKGGEKRTLELNSGSTKIRGNVFHSIIHKAIYVHFRAKESSTNPRFSSNNFMKYNTEISANAAKRWKIQIGVTELLTSIYALHGDTPFEKHSDVEWIKEGGLIHIYHIPEAILKEYTLKPFNVRYVNPFENKQKYTRKKISKYQKY